MPAGLALAAGLFGFVLLPLAALVARATREAGTLSTTSGDVSGDALWRSLCLSLELGLGAALVAVVAGLAWALLSELAELPGRRLWRGAALLPVALPPFLPTLAAIELFGASGTPTSGLAAEWLYSRTSCCLLLGFGAFGLVSLPTGACLSRLTREQVEAADLGRGRLGIVLTTLRAARPGLLLGASLVFVMTLIRFATPLLLRIDALPQLVHARFASFRDVPGAVRAMIPLLVLAATAGALVAWRLRDFELRDGGSGRPWRPLRSRAARALVMIALLLLLLPPLWLPLAVLTRALLAAPELDQLGLIGLVRQSLATPADLGATLIAAFGAAGVVWLFGWLAALARPDRGSAGPIWWTLLTALAAVPGPILGIGLVLLWHRPGLPFLVYDSPAILIVAALGRTLPAGLLVSFALLARHPQSEDEAAELAGRSPLALAGRLREHGLAAALVFVLTVGEYGASSLITPPGWSPLAVKVVNLVHFGRTGETGVLALLLALLALGPGLALAAAAGGPRDAA